jgi:hypothetical protein
MIRLLSGISPYIVRTKKQRPKNNNNDNDQYILVSSGIRNILSSPFYSAREDQ